MEEEEQQEMEELKEFNLILGKKKKKKKIVDEEPIDDGEGDYTYIFLLERIMKQKRQEEELINPKQKNVSTISNSDKLRLVVNRYGSKKMCWSNFGIVCDKMQDDKKMSKNFLNLKQDLFVLLLQDKV